MVNNVVSPDQKFYMLIAVFFLTLLSAIPVYKAVVDIGSGVTHRNHEDTITTPAPGNCECGYPDCGGCDGQPAITLMPTDIIDPIPTFGGTPAPATPDIPDATQFPTTFPTFDITAALPTPLVTVGVPTIAPTLVPPNVPPSPVPVSGDQ